MAQEIHYSESRSETAEPLRLEREIDLRSIAGSYKTLMQSSAIKSPFLPLSGQTRGYFIYPEASRSWVRIGRGTKMPQRSTGVDRASSIITGIGVALIAGLIIWLISAVYGVSGNIGDLRAEIATQVGTLREDLGRIETHIEYLRSDVSEIRTSISQGAPQPPANNNEVK